MEKKRAKRVSGRKKRAGRREFSAVEKGGWQGSAGQKKGAGGGSFRRWEKAGKGGIGRKNTKKEKASCKKAADRVQ